MHSYKIKGKRFVLIRSNKAKVHPNQSSRNPIRVYQTEGVGKCESPNCS